MNEYLENSKINERDYITSLGKGLDVLRAFDEHTPVMNVTDLSQKLEISRASARRYLLTLEHLDYLTNEGRYYRLTSKVLELGMRYFASMPISKIAQPHLEKITTKSKESSTLGVLENNVLVFTARAQSKWIVDIGLKVGARIPAYCTGMGRVLLASKSEVFQKQYLKHTNIEAFNDNTITNKKKLLEIFKSVRNQGFSIVDQEIETGLRAIAVPIHVDGNVIASISISSPVNRASINHMKSVYLPLLRDAAVNISAELNCKL